MIKQIPFLSSLSSLRIDILICTKQEINKTHDNKLKNYVNSSSETRKTKLQRNGQQHIFVPIKFIRFFRVRSFMGYLLLCQAVESFIAFQYHGTSNRFNSRHSTNSLLSFESKNKRFPNVSIRSSSFSDENALSQTVDGVTTSITLQKKSKIPTPKLNSKQTNTKEKGINQKQVFGQISPWDVLLKQDPNEDCYDTETMSSLIRRPRSLQSALMLLEKVLKLIANHENEAALDILNHNSVTYNEIMTIRIEIPIVDTMTVDPLAWLHSQDVYISKQKLLSMPSMFYMNTQESNIEVATIGSAIQWNRTDQLWKDIYNILPENSFIYGGQRFDHHTWKNSVWESNNASIGKQTRTTSKSATKIAKSEWEAFGQALWMLPTIELRRQQTPLSFQSTKTTLALHLVRHENNIAWSSVAHAAFNNVLKYVSHTQSTLLPPTTLPPILSRSTHLNSAGTDGQEIYESAFDAAMNEFALSSSNDTSPNSVCSSSRLQKVVLARQQTLNFGTYFSTSLDLIRRWKYGGNEGGHLFWIKPSTFRANSYQQDCSSSIEFLGCTPERLFQIIPANETTTIVRSEALAGTRPRGSTQSEDEQLLQELCMSPKDRLENRLTGEFIQAAFDELELQNMIKQSDTGLIKSSSGADPEKIVYKQENTTESENDIHLSEESIDKVVGADEREPEHFNSSTLSPSTKETQPIVLSSLSTATLPKWSRQFFVRRLLHLQHICQSYVAELIKHQNDKSTPSAMKAAQFLLSRLHPTPAVCGVPTTRSLQFIQQYEMIGFDRGFYSGPLGYIGRNEADILVAIRSGLAITSTKPNLVEDDIFRNSPMHSIKKTELSVYAGGGIVPGSTLRDEWAETNYKFAVISSLFPQSPMTLRSSTTPNVAWATAFIEELVRNGITRFYICPGSRSTPLVVAIARAVRANSLGGSGGGIVQAVSIHDERAAAFRCIGYARGNGRPAAVITSSGTAVANLYPAIIEAGMDGLPMVLLTADRPYENRDSGANQAIDQVKVFSSKYIRWFRDILPPSDEVPVSIALSDANHAVTMARQLRGPVHLNIQFRENLAPDPGKIRNDDRVDSVTKYNGMRFTDVPGFQQWSTSGKQWSKSYSFFDSMGSYPSPSWMEKSVAAADIAHLIQQSKRGIIVVGNLRLPVDEYLHQDQSSIVQAIADFAEMIGFPVFAGVQSANLRFVSPAVIPFAEHLLKCPAIFDNLDPDLIIQIGAPLVSTGIVDLISFSMKPRNKYGATDEAFADFTSSSNHVLIHPHISGERSDPGFTVTHRISSEITPFLTAVSHKLKEWKDEDKSLLYSSQLAPLVSLGRKLQSEMKAIIEDAANRSTVYAKPDGSMLSEPQVVVALVEAFFANQDTDQQSLFLSNSMPVRDADFFLYPYNSEISPGILRYVNQKQHGPKAVGVNRGASGIDGVISSALGFAESTQTQTTLLIGDVAALHDIGSFHSVAERTMSLNQTPTKKRQPLVTVVVNNNGGGIFSFLPIAQHGNDVAFEEFFGTPTSTFSFEKGAQAFGLPVERASDYTDFRRKLEDAMLLKKDYVIEATVTSRDTNVEIHKQITSSVQSFVEKQLESQSVHIRLPERLPMKTYVASGPSDKGPNSPEKKILVLLHGWMGNKAEWDDVALHLQQILSPEWVMVSLDLPGHGGSALRKSWDADVFRKMLRLDSDKKFNESNDLNIDALANAALLSLSLHHKKIDAIAGYSAGGRVALAMKRLCSQKSVADSTWRSLIDANTALILLSANPGDMLVQKVIPDMQASKKDFGRMILDDALAAQIDSISDRCSILRSQGESRSMWNEFLDLWYSHDIWGTLNKKKWLYNALLSRRSRELNRRGRDLAAVLKQCSPPRQYNRADWKYCSPDRLLYVAGSRDPKYSTIGKILQRKLSCQIENIEGAGHALLVEAPIQVADLIADFICSECNQIIRKEDEVRDYVFQRLENQLAFPAAALTETVDIEPTGKFAEDDTVIVIGTLEMKQFSICLFDRDRDEASISGIGWGQSAKANEKSSFSRRDGFVIQFDSANDLEVGIGEVSPLLGVHAETLEQDKDQLLRLQERLSQRQTEERPTASARQLLTLQGEMQNFIKELERFAGVDEFYPSVKSGIEMAVLALSSQKTGLPIHQALGQSSSNGRKRSPIVPFQVSGLITRVSSFRRSFNKDASSDRKFPSVKVKVGHQDPHDDAVAMLRGFQRSELYHGIVRADANRAWNESQAIAFAVALEGLEVHALERVEFVEEPLQKLCEEDGGWSFAHQVEALERTFFHSGIPYALDESLADIVADCEFNFTLIEKELTSVFAVGPRGCAAFILKPALLGLEMSMQLARLARAKLGIGAVFSSCFDSGVGLAYTAFLGNLANEMISTTQVFPHGIGTFTMLESDTLTPAFETFVNDEGILNIPSLSRAMYGLSLEEMRDFTEDEPLPVLQSGANEARSVERAYEASTATSSSGKEISVVVALPLPFSAETACLRFTDLPSMPRWSPWISSVQYQGTETEWSINIRGIQLKWRAESRIVDYPYPGIQWQSVSGLSNNGIVEFVPDTSSSCTMNVRMTIVTPRLLKPLFQGTSIFVEEFLRDKLLKWSLEMFRDVVKADLAIERGDVELGDALIGAVEGKATAIEATLNSTRL